MTNAFANTNECRSHSPRIRPVSPEGHSHSLLTRPDSPKCYYVTQIRCSLAQTTPSVSPWYAVVRVAPSMVPQAVANTIWGYQTLGRIPGRTWQMLVVRHVIDTHLNSHLLT